MYRYKLEYKGLYAPEKTMIGQCFRWQKRNGYFEGILDSAYFKILVENNFFLIETSKKFEEEDLYKKFDLLLDVQKIDKILKKDLYLHNLWRRTEGIRLLKQPLFETIISFMISANNNIPRIQKSVETLSILYGDLISTDKCTYFAFPNIKQMSKLSVEDFKDCGLGYRAINVKLIVDNINNGEFDLNTLEKLDTIEAKEMLMTQKGIGPKVSDCILLFGMHRTDMFPVDTWIKKALTMYGKYLNEGNIDIIKEQIVSKYGLLSGYIQQAMFYDLKWGGNNEG